MDLYSGGGVDDIMGLNIIRYEQNISCEVWGSHGYACKYYCHLGSDAM